MNDQIKRRKLFSKIYHRIRKNILLLENYQIDAKSQQKQTKMSFSNPPIRN